MKQHPQQMNLYQAQLKFLEIQAAVKTHVLGMNLHTMTNMVRDHHHNLLIKKQLPHFYLNESANKLGISIQTCRPSKIDSCLRNTIQDQTQVRDLLLILMDVELRLMNSPIDETYYEAMRSLKSRIKELKQNDYSHNQIAIQANLSHKTLSDIIRDRESDSHRRHRCPWDLLEKLRNAEEKIETQREYTSHQQKIMRPGKNGGFPAAPRMPTEYDFIEPDDPCLKCGASWNHLYRNGNDLWNHAVMTCITCNKDNLINLGKILARRTNKHRRLETNGPCPQCLAPWQNQVREGINPERKAVYTCNICQGENILEKRQPTPIGGR